MEATQLAYHAQHFLPFPFTPIQYVFNSSKKKQTYKSITILLLDFMGLRVAHYHSRVGNIQKAAAFPIIILLKVIHVISIPPSSSFHLKTLVLALKAVILMVLESSCFGPTHQVNYCNEFLQPTLLPSEKINSALT